MSKKNKAKAHESKKTSVPKVSWHHHVIKRLTPSPELRAKTQATVEKIRAKIKNRERLARYGKNITKYLWIFFLLTFLFPRGITIAIPVQTTVLTWFVTASELLLPIVLIGALLFYPTPSKSHAPRLLWIWIGALLLSVLASATFHSFPNFDLLLILRLLELWVVSYLVILKITTLPQTLALILFGLGVQEILGLTQFFGQESLGWNLIGEPSLSPQTYGIGKIAIGTNTIIRPVGTLVHANAFGAALVLAIGLVPLWYRTALAQSPAESLQRVRTAISHKLQLQTVAIAAGIFFVFGTLFSFSRASWIALILLALIYIWHLRKKVWLMASGVFIVAAICFTQIEAIATRLATLETAIMLRIELIIPALKIIVQNPFGIGVGRFPLALQTLESTRLFAPWELQPVHNVWLLLGTELGWLALTITILITLMYIVHLSREHFVTIIAGIGLLCAMFTDHFFWDNASMLILLTIALTALECDTESLISRNTIANLKNLRKPSRVKRQK